MPEPKHTPLPWKDDAGGHINTDELKPKAVASTNSHSNTRFPHDAAFIVLACNSHYELLEALRGLLATPHTNPYEMVGHSDDGHALNAEGSARKRARTAIIKATK